MTVYVIIETMPYGEDKAIVAVRLSKREAEVVRDEVQKAWNEKFPEGRWLVYVEPHDPDSPYPRTNCARG